MKILSALLLLLTAANPPQVTGREAVVGLPCEGCEAVFQGIPQTLRWSARIAPVEEPGEAMVLRGKVTAPDGSPAPGIVIYAYQTDAHGIYPTPNGFAGAALRHGRLRGWAQTDESGNYRFDTIRPASYPNQTVPAHVHLHVIEPGRNTYYIDELLFADDPLLTADLRRRLAPGRGGEGAVARPVRDSKGVWQTHRDISLGRGIPDYR